MIFDYDSYRFCSRQQENPELTESQVFMYFSRLGLEEEEEDVGST